MNVINRCFLAVIICISVFTSCEKEYFKPTIISETDTISFKNVLIPIFSENCAISGCHVTGAIPPYLTADKAYKTLIGGDLLNISNPNQSKLYLKITSGTMAQYLDKPEDNTRILIWIKQGSKNN